MEELGHLIWDTKLSIVEIKLNGHDGQKNSCGGLTLSGCQVPTQLLPHQQDKGGK